MHQNTHFSQVLIIRYEYGESKWIIYEFILTSHPIYAIIEVMK